MRQENDKQEDKSHEVVIALMFWVALIIASTAFATYFIAELF